MRRRRKSGSAGQKEKPPSANGETEPFAEGSCALVKKEQLAGQENSRPQSGAPTASPAKYPQGAGRIHKAAKPPTAALRVVIGKEELGSGRMTSFLP